MLVDGLFEKYGATPRIRMELGSNEAIEQAVRDGLGISILSGQAGGDTPDAGLCTLDVEGFPLERVWYLVYDSEARLSPCARMFVEHLLQPEVLGELRSSGRVRRLAGSPCTPAVYSDAPTNHN